jgi:hypothetical protein
LSGISDSRTYETMKAMIARLFEEIVTLRQAQPI